MKILIVGPGAMGCLFASLLIKSGFDVHILDKNPTRANHIRKNGIKTTGISKIYIPPSKIKITTDCKKIGPADILIVFVKAQRTEEAIRKSLPCISKNTIILTLQNGLGNIETIASALKKSQKKVNAVLAGITSHGATLTGHGAVRHAGKGLTVIGDAVYTGSKLHAKIGPSVYTDANPHPEPPALIKNIFNGAGIKTKTTKNIKNVLWSKLVINSAINPIGSITLRTNGEIIKNSCLKDILCMTAEESAGVAKKSGIKLLYKNPSKKVLQVCKSTAKNYNSMLQDILHRKKTEIESINGAVIKQAEKTGLDTPLNKMLYCFVKLMEEHCV
ncbi:MAG: 2-dehydropantoate 2-reductase [Elusimicrobia bacterium]|nr:2-dehydropantoate 2-reductase [Elusimicrobiota bacterium]